jgi:SAM-dependent methyltransferase
LLRDDPREEPSILLETVRKATSHCNICGGEEFVFGSLVREQSTPPPQCASCKTVERHRIVRGIYEHLKPVLSGRRAFQFAPDRSVEPEWFSDFESSVYGSSNSVDMMNTGFADGAFDLVISNHVLEHIADDTAAMRETLRIAGPTGVVHVCVPSPLRQWATQDWGYPDAKIHYHYRLYGADFPVLMCRKINNVHCIGVVGQDPITGTADIVYFFSFTSSKLASLAHQLMHYELPVVRFTD